MRKFLFILCLLIAWNVQAQCSFQLLGSFQSQSPYVFDCVGMSAVLNLSVDSEAYPYQVEIQESAIVLFDESITPINVVQNPDQISVPLALLAGNYSVTITDNNGAVCTLAFDLLNPTPISITPVPTAPVSCDPGFIDVSISGGTPPYDVGYLQNGQLVPNYAQGVASQVQITGLMNANYVVTVSDALGCLQSEGNTNPISLVQTVFPPELNGTANGQLAVCVSGGEAPFTFNLLEGGELQQTAANITENCQYYSLCEGEYVVELLDNRGCPANYSQSVPELLITLSAEESNASVSGGVAPYQEIAWLYNNELMPLETQLQLSTSMCPGSYTCRVTDQIGCVRSETVLIEEIETEWLDEVDCSDLALSGLEITPTGGVPPYSVLWNTGEITFSISDLSPQTYSATITDANGCETEYNIVLPALTEDCLFNVFSPREKDNVNDIWSINPSFLYADSRVTVYNRYGKKVFDSVGYETPWDGTNESGKPLRQGVYFYVVQLQEGIAPFKGTVTLF